MKASFNLVDRGFIPVQWSDGRPDEVGLREALVRAHEIREIRDDSPLVTVSLHRILLAILHRVFGPRNLSEWGTLWNAGQFDSKRISAYLDQWHDRFDLFGDCYPFYQTVGLSSNKPQPISSLWDELSGGNNAMLFDHTCDNAPTSVGPPIVARALITRQTYGIGFGKSPDCTIAGKTIRTGYRSDAPLTRGLSLLLVGDSLWETLLCNLTGYRDNPSVDLPCWERQDAEAQMAREIPHGRVDLYTWQTRRLRLIPSESPDGSVVVSHIHFAQGRSLTKVGIFDPMKPYRDEDGTWAMFPLDPARSIWRDYSSIITLVGIPDRPAYSLSWTGEAMRERRIARTRDFRISVFGIATEPGKAGSVLMWRHEVFPLPGVYLEDGDLRGCLAEATKTAESAAKTLRDAIWRLAKILSAPDQGGRPDKDRVRQLVDSLGADRVYWSRLEVPFRHFLVELPKAADGKGRLSAWARQVCGTAGKVFDQVTRNVGSDGRTLKAIHAAGGASEQLAIGLAAILEAHRMGKGDTDEQ